MFYCKKQNKEFKTTKLYFIASEGEMWAPSGPMQAPGVGFPLYTEIFYFITQ